MLPVLVLSILVFDQITKFFALRYLASQESVPVFPGIFHLTFVQNRGIAFGFFYEYQSLLLVLITASLIFLFLWALRIHPEKKGQLWALGLILGGALGNWIDRLRLGYVVDFFDFRIWPVFNIADIAISTGVGIYLLLLFRKRV